MFEVMLMRMGSELALKADEDGENPFFTNGVCRRISPLLSLHPIPISFDGNDTIAIGSGCGSSSLPLLSSSSSSSLSPPGKVTTER
jgi:hypothetical protein